MYTFMLIAYETLEPISTKALTFLAVLGCRFALVTGDPCEISFLFQRHFITVQYFNSSLFQGRFATPPNTQA